MNINFTLISDLLATAVCAPESWFVDEAGSAASSAYRLGFAQATPCGFGSAQAATGVSRIRTQHNLTASPR